MFAGTLLRLSILIMSSMQVFMAYTDTGSIFVFGPKYIDHPFAFKVCQIPWTLDDDEDDKENDDGNHDDDFPPGNANYRVYELCLIHPLLRWFHAVADM